MELQSISSFSAYLHIFIYDISLPSVYSTLLSHRRCVYICANNRTENTTHVRNVRTRTSQNQRQKDNRLIYINNNNNHPFDAYIQIGIYTCGKCEKLYVFIWRTKIKYATSVIITLYCDISIYISYAYISFPCRSTWHVSLLPHTRIHIYCIYIFKKLPICAKQNNIYIYVDYDQYRYDDNNDIRIYMWGSKQSSGSKIPYHLVLLYIWDMFGYINIYYMVVVIAFSAKTFYFAQNR